MKKIKYLNASGVPTPTPSGGGVNADLIAQGVQVLVGLVSSSISAKTESCKNN